MLSIKPIYQLKVSSTPVWLLSKWKFKVQYVQVSEKKNTVPNKSKHSKLRASPFQ